MTKQTGRLTLPTDADIVEETIRLKNLLGADALRDWAEIAGCVIE